MSEAPERPGWSARLAAAIDDPRPQAIAAVTLIALVLLPIVGLALVSIANLVPDRPIMDELVAAVDARRITPTFGPRSTSGRLMDTWTDCVTVSIGLGDAPDTARWSAALRTPTLGNCEAAVPRIRGWSDGDGLLRQFEYFRYWHGTSTVSRPLIATIGLVATRIVTGWILLGTLAGLCWSLGRRHGWVVPIALLGPFALTTDVLDLATSLHQAWAVIVALAAAWAAHVLVVRRWSPGRVLLLSTIAGAAFVFVDLLTIPPGVWALTVFVVVAAASQRLGGRPLALTAALGAFGWLLGYAWMWAAKWALATLVYGVGRVRDDIVDQTTFRLDGQPDYLLDLSFGAGVRRTMGLWLDHPLTVPVLVGLTALVVGVVASRYHRDPAALARRWPDRVVLMAPALIPLLWFETVRNHTQIHVFPARSVPLAVGIVAAALLIRLAPRTAAPSPTREEHDPERAERAESSQAAAAGTLGP